MYPELTVLLSLCARASCNFFLFPPFPFPLSHPLTDLLYSHTPTHPVYKIHSSIGLFLYRKKFFVFFYDELLNGPCNRVWKNKQQKIFTQHSMFTLVVCPWKNPREFSYRSSQLPFLIRRQTVKNII